MGKLVKGYWDCQYCDEKGIDGEKRECPSCGKARDESVKFYMKGVNYLSEEEAAKKTGRPDWFCEFCHSYNPDSEDTCISCGAPRGEDNGKDYHEMQQIKAEKEAKKQAEQEEAMKAYNGGGKKKTPIILIILLLAILGIIIFSVVSCIGKKKDMTVQSVSWEKGIDIEKYSYVEQSDWNLPADAELIKTNEEIHHYDTVMTDVLVTKSREVQNGYDVSYEDNGDGTFEEIQTPHYDTEYYEEYEKQPVEVPVYETKYYYYAWAWVNDHTETASGDSHDTYWPQLDLGEDEREGQKHENYKIVVVDDKNNQTTYEVDYSTWSGLNPGDGVTIRVKSGNDQLLDANGNVIAELK